jgi:2OG-Fe(II) oxygenase superfamily
MSSDRPSGRRYRAFGRNTLCIAAGHRHGVMGAEVTAREQVAAVLDAACGDAAPCVQLECEPQALALEVAGIGPIRLPVSAQRARSLRALGRPARFGRGEQTLTDPAVRDTWEIPLESVRAVWGPEWESALETVRVRLGLPPSCTLTAQLHSLLVYEPGQFFVKHQDSEKHDAMIGTLVVGLPSRHTGGELIVEHAGTPTTCRGSQDALSLAAFYADCRHEVRPLKSGYRIALTYNLLAHGDTVAALAEDAAENSAAVADLTRSIADHFSTAVTRPSSRKPAAPPKRLVYLLDHEYSARGLGWDRLKGVDARRTALLRAAAGQADCDTALALTEIQQTWSAQGPEDEDEYWDDEYDDEDDEDFDEDEEDEEDEEDDGELGGSGGRAAVDYDDYQLDDLIDSTTTLVHWIGADGTIEQIKLDVEDFEQCASTATDAIRPYAQEYEGYMGNYGNTMDRWYRRAAVVLWPHGHSSGNRAEADPAGALTELRAHATG